MALEAVPTQSDDWSRTRCHAQSATLTAIYDHLRTEHEAASFEGSLSAVKCLYAGLRADKGVAAKDAAVGPRRHLAAVPRRDRLRRLRPRYGPLFLCRPRRPVCF